MKKWIPIIIIALLIIYFAVRALNADNIWIPIIFFITALSSLPAGFLLAASLLKSRMQFYSQIGLDPRFLRLRDFILPGITLGFLIICVPATILVWLLSWKVSLVFILVVIVILISVSDVGKKNMKFYSVWERFVAILAVLAALGGFIYLNIATYKQDIGVGGIPVIIGKWQGKICDKAFCTKEATHTVDYGLIRKSTSLRFCDEHVNESPNRIIGESRGLELILASVGTIAAFLFLGYRIYVIVKNGFYEFWRNLGWLAFSMIIAFSAPTVGAWLGV